MPDGIPSTYFLIADEEPLEILRRVIAGFPRFGHIDPQDFRIVYKVANDSRFVAEIRKFSRLYSVFSPRSELLLTIFRPAWEGFSHPKKIAVIYHELLHIGYNEKTNEYRLVRHDVEDFKEMIDTVGMDYSNSMAIQKMLMDNEQNLQKTLSESAPANSAMAALGPDAPEPILTLDREGEES